MDRADTTSLLLEARAGTPEALDALFRQVSGRLLTLIRIRMSRDDRAGRESRDVLQATLLRAFEHLDRFEGAGGASLMAWLARIAENEIRDWRDYRHRARRDAARRSRAGATRRSLPPSGTDMSGSPWRSTPRCRNRSRRLR
jgi:DNA-directed RNA polymerase specialized sigma24 family protein